MRFGLAPLACSLFCLASVAQEPMPAQRGERALTSRAFVAATWTADSYANLWKHWQPAPASAPKNYDEAARDYYGLHAAPYDNGGLPMGLREGKTYFGGKGIAVDCLLCHGGSIAGRSHVGLGNSALDIQALWEDFGKASGGSGKLPFTFGHTRGTSEAGSFAVYLLRFREPDLGMRFPPHKMALPEHLCEDVPAWWLLKKKKRMYHTGTSDARSVRSIMQFMLTPENGLKVFEKEEATFRDIQAYLLSLEAPKYPFAVDRDLAHKGEKLFAKNCAQCHGTYGDKAFYPGKIVPLDVIGTDPRRLEGFPLEVGELYNKSWLAREVKDGYAVTKPEGYLAPPLDGIWATAPYFHNGSAPTLLDVLDSRSRPRIFTRSFRTDEESYDKAKVGWKVRVVDDVPADVSAHERRKYYDTTQPGRRNTGHTFGDDFTAEERRAVIEYLKTL